MTRRTRNVSLHRLVLLATAFGLVGAIAAPVRADDDYEKVARQVRRAYDAHDYKKALELSEKLHEMRPKDVAPIYNIGCMHCLLGHKDEAFKWLEKAVDAGYRDAGYMAEDYDLKTLWGERRFRSLLRRIRRSQGESTEKKPPEKPEQQEKPELSPQEIAQKVGELTTALIAASDAGRRDEALRLARQALELADIGITNYNVACMLSLLNRKDKALEHLEIAVKKGIDGRDMAELMAGDSDLDNIRKDPRYKKALAAAGGKPRPARPSRTTDVEEKEVAAKWSVTVPQGLDKSAKAPLIVALHPFHGSMERTTERWKEAAAEVGAILLTPQGTFDMGDGQFQWGRDLDQIGDNVMDAIDDVVDEHNIDQKKIVLGGFSQGGWATWGLALRTPETFRGIIPVCGMCRPESESAFADDDLKDLRVFIMLGADERDRVKDANRRAARRLREIGAKVRSKSYDGVGHGFPENRTKELVKALRFILE